MDYSTFVIFHHVGIVLYLEYVTIIGEKELKNTVKCDCGVENHFANLKCKDCDKILI